MKNVTFLLLSMKLLFTSCQKEEILNQSDLETVTRDDLPYNGDSNPPHESNPCWDGIPDNLRVLFIGNSFTANYTVDIPTMFHELALASGQSVANVSKSAILGYTLSQHLTNATTQNLIDQGDWDYVILQENSGFLANAPNASTSFKNSVNSMVANINADSPSAQILLYQVVAPVSHTNPQFNNINADWDLLFDDVASNHTNVSVTDISGAFSTAYFSFNSPGLFSGNDILRLGNAYQFHYLNTGGFISAVTFYSDIFNDKPCVPAQMTFWIGGSTQGLDDVNNQVFNLDEILQIGYVNGFNSSPPAPLPSDCPQVAMWGLGNGPC